MVFAKSTKLFVLIGMHWWVGPHGHCRLDHCDEAVTVALCCFILSQDIISYASGNKTKQSQTRAYLRFCFHVCQMVGGLLMAATVDLSYTVFC